MEAEGTFDELQNSESMYAHLLTEEQPTEEDKQKAVDIAKISRQMSTRVSNIFCITTNENELFGTLE